jgi:azurin
MFPRLALLTLLALVAPLSAQDASTVIELKPSANAATALAYDKAEFTAKAGEKIKLVMNNMGGIVPQPHNVVLCKPGTAEKVMGAAMALLSDPNGMAKSYVPESTDVLAHTKFANPGQSESIEVTLPAEVGDYPFFCSYPGHSAIMKGVIKVAN